MLENNYCYDITKYYVKLFLFITIVMGFPIIVLLLLYMDEVNKCIIKKN